MLLNPGASTRRLAPGVEMQMWGAHYQGQRLVVRLARLEEGVAPDVHHESYSGNLEVTKQASNPRDQ